MILTEADIRLASRRLIAAYGGEAWFIASDLAIAAARAGNSSAADLCHRIAQAIEEAGASHARALTARDDRLAYSRGSMNTTGGVRS